MGISIDRLIDSLIGGVQIPVQMDLPVGHNLQDHIAVVGLEYLLTSKIGSSEQKAKSLMALFDYFVFGKGNFITHSFPLCYFFRFVFATADCNL